MHVALALKASGWACHRHMLDQRIVYRFIVGLRSVLGTSAIHLDIQGSLVNHNRSLPSKPGSGHWRLLGSHLPVVMSKA